MVRLMLTYTFLEIFSLSCFVLFVFFSFCDGFSLRPGRKMIWAVYFLAFSYVPFWATGRFNVALIVLLSSLMAFVLAWFQQRENKIKEKKQSEGT